MNKLNWKRIYEKTEEADGFRVFVDRLWARGMKRKMPKLITGQRKLHLQRSLGKITIKEELILRRLQQDI